MTQTEWFVKKAEEEKARVDAAHALRMSQRRASMATDPGGFNPWEKKAVDDYYAQKYRERRDEANDDYRNKELGTREKVAEFGMMGQRDAGATAAGITAEAAKHGADMTFKGIEAQAKSNEEIARQKAKAEKWIAGRNADVTESVSKREWGYVDEKGNYVPGGRVRQAQAQGEGAAKVAAMNNETKLEAERIKAATNEKKALLSRDAQIQRGLANNLPFMNEEDKEKLLTRAAALDMTPEDTSAYIEFLATRKTKGAQVQGTARTEEIRRRSAAQNAE